MKKVATATTQAANMELYTGLLTFLNKHIGEK
jgi:hypothetical protein